MSKDGLDTGLSWCLSVLQALGVLLFFAPMIHRGVHSGWYQIVALFEFRANILKVVR